MGGQLRSSGSGFKEPSGTFIFNRFKLAVYSPLVEDPCYLSVPGWSLSQSDIIIFYISWSLF